MAPILWGRVPTWVSPLFGALPVNRCLMVGRRYFKRVIDVLLNFSQVKKINRNFPVNQQVRCFSTKPRPLLLHLTPAACFDDLVVPWLTFNLCILSSSITSQVNVIGSDSHGAIFPTIATRGERLRHLKNIRWETIRKGNSSASSRPASSKHRGNATLWFLLLIYFRAAQRKTNKPVNSLDNSVKRESGVRRGDVSPIFRSKDSSKPFTLVAITQNELMRADDEMHLITNKIIMSLNTCFTFAYIFPSVFSRLTVGVGACGQYGNNNRDGCRVFSTSGSMRRLSEILQVIILDFYVISFIFLYLDLLRDKK